MGSVSADRDLCSVVGVVHCCVSSESQMIRRKVEHPVEKRLVQPADRATRMESVSVN